MGCRSSKSSVNSTKTGKPCQAKQTIEIVPVHNRASEHSVAKQNTDTCSVPKQVKDTNDLLEDEEPACNPGSSDDMEAKYDVALGDKNDIFMTELPLPWIDVLNEVSDCDIWLGVRRNERSEWQEYFKIADELAKRPAKELSLKTKVAVYNGDVNIPDLPDMNRNVLVFVSSTFTDTKAERNHLMKDVYPYVRDVCRHLGLDFGTIDMRWGVTDDATKHHSTVQMCVDEIQRCIRESCGPSFLCILSHKYGYRPIPAYIEESEYDKILAYLINNQRDTTLLKKYYRLDKNAIEHEYVLRSMRDDEDKTQWWTDIEAMQEQMREAVVECFHGNMEICDKYFVSVTETEIQTGALTNSQRDTQSYFIIRELQDVSTKVNQHRRLMDMNGPELNDDAHERLQALIHTKIPEHVQKRNMNTIEYEYPTVNGTMRFVSRFCDTVCKKLINLIFENFREKGIIETDPDFVEVVQQLKLAEDKRKVFVGREKELESIADYLTRTSDNIRHLVISGISGSGKTSLMAVAAGKAKELFNNSVVVVRFIGTTSQSGSVRNLLFSVCKQIALAYSQDVSMIPDSTRELADYYWNALNNATEITPLIIILDSLDQLTADDNGRTLEWLKLDKDLPKNIRIVLSSLETDTLSVLQNHLPQENFVAVTKLLPGEGPDILTKMLTIKDRTLTEPQKKLVMDAFINTPLPLYLRLAADVASKWKSYDTVLSENISTTIKGMILLLFERLDKKYGEIFMRHALAYITAAKEGLSQTELEDILSCDDDVLDSLFQYWIPPMRRIPSLLWARVRHELGSYLAEKGSDGVTVFTWFHREFKETAGERYLNAQTAADGTNMKQKAHLAIADYFDGKWTEGKEYIPKGEQTKTKGNSVLEDRGLLKQPMVFGDGVMGNRNINRRKIRELPYHMLQLGNVSKFTKLFLDIEYIEAKFEAGMGHEYFNELTEGTHISGADNMVKMVRFIGANLSFLLREPSSVYQLASQKTEHHPIREQLKQLNILPVSLVTNKTQFSDSDNDVCELTLQGHKRSPFSCDFSPKGDKIVSTSVDGCLRIWDVLTGAEIAVSTSLPSSIDPDDRAEERMLLHTVNPCCFSRDGATIAIGTEDAEIIVYDSSGTKLRHEVTDNREVTCVQFSPDNKTLATGFRNGTVCLWIAETLENSGSVNINREVFGLDFSSTGDKLAVACRAALSQLDMKTVTLDWLAHYQPVDEQKVRSRRAQRPDLILCCCYHPSGNWIMTGSADNHIGIWDVSRHTCIKTLGAHPAWIWSIKITEDGLYMFSASSDRTIKLWTSSNNADWEVVSTFHGHSHRVVCLSLEPNTESRLVSASLDCTLKVWNTCAMKRQKTEGKALGQYMHFNSLAISPSTLQIAMSNGWSQWCVVRGTDELDDNDNMRTASHKGFIKKTEFTCDGSKLVVLDHGHLGDYMAKASLRAKCIVYDAMDCTKLQKLNVYEDGTDGPTSFSCGLSYIAVGTFLGLVWLFDINTYTPITSWEWKPNISSISCSMGYNYVVATSGMECTLWKISDRLGKQHMVAEFPEHDSNITTSTFSPNGCTFVTGVDSGKIYVWNISDNSVEMAHKLTRHTAPIKDVTFSKSGAYMVTCADLSSRVWDMENGCIQKGVYYGPVNCAVFRGEQEFLAGDATGQLMTLCF